MQFTFLCLLWVGLSFNMRNMSWFYRRVLLRQKYSTRSELKLPPQTSPNDNNENLKLFNKINV